MRAEMRWFRREKSEGMYGTGQVTYPHRKQEPGEIVLSVAHQCMSKLGLGACLVGLDHEYLPMGVGALGEPCQVGP